MSMAFYIVIKGRLTPFQFEYLDNKVMIRLEQTLASGSPKTKTNSTVTSDVYAIDVMTKKLITLSPAARIRDAEALMSKHKIHHIPLIIDSKLTGMISKRDLAENMIDFEKEIRLDKVMSKMVLAASEGTPLRHVAEVFLKENIDSLPIVSDEFVVTGIITHRDLLRWLIDQQKFSK
jgi:CBS domain-containing membrane protein